LHKTANTLLKRLTHLFDRSSSQKAASSQCVLTSDEHSLNPADICKNAREIIRVLQSKNFEAYVVGGCVRDILLNLNPKDFDIATNATPQQVKQLFRRSRIIGRRFQIVHVQFGRDIIEVTTFRSNDTEQTNLVQQEKNGLLTRDNKFGSLVDDATRRDLTINALYYDTEKNTLHDYCDGLDDLESQTIRIIGTPSIRYSEDPVRMLRVARFAGKLGFDVESKTAKPIIKLGHKLKHVSSPRMFDETLKLFMSGYGLEVFERLLEYKLFAHLFPQTNRLIEQGHPTALAMVKQALTNTDQRLQKKQRVTPAFIYAAMLWPAVQKIAQELQNHGQPATTSINKAASEVISNQIPITAIPKRFTLAMREIWAMQLTLPKRGGNRAKRLMEQPRFRAAYDFVLLREQTGEKLDGLGEWWTKYQDADENSRQQMVQKLNTGYSQGRKPRRRPRKTD
jgi:poly(A) polymerase